MLRYLFAVILFAHGLIHLLGFAKAFKLADIPQLVQPISKLGGALWLISAVLFVLATALFLWKKEIWWAPAAVAVVLSQILIMGSWSEAKFGAIANILILIALVVGFGRWNFNRMAMQEIKAFLEVPVADRKTITRDMIQGFPPIVQKWLEHSGAVGKAAYPRVYLKQKGEMRTNPEGKWIPFTADQHFNFDKPGFIWRAEIKAGPSIHIAGRDKYVDGRGNMLIKLMSLLTIADAKGPETDQGTMLRFLAEMCWNPGASVCDYILWEPADSLSAKATMTCGGIQAAGLFHFNEDGDIEYFEAKRYYTDKEGAALEDWLVVNKEWTEKNGVRFPHKCEVTWKLKTGDFTWLKLEILDITHE